jgi:hypothetical protein
VKATIDSVDGASAAVEAPYQATDCAGLPFAPRMSGSIAARGPGRTPDKPAFKTVIDIPKGHSASRKVQVKLPAALAVDAKRLVSTCLNDQRAAGACPAASRVGTATAVSSLLPVPLTGPVYLAQIPGASLPGLHLELNGPVTLRLDGKVGL